MSPANSHEPVKNITVKTADKKDGKAGAGAVMDDAPLFAGLDDFILIQTEKKKTGTQKTGKPKEKVKAAHTEPAASGEALPKQTPKPQKTRQPPDPNALLLSVAEMCALLKISRATLVRMDKAGKIPGRIKLGGSVRFHRETIEAWLKSLITA